MINIKKVKKGELLIKEGEMSETLYWLQSGSLRLFKKKGKGFVELGVIHSGELVGEMSFMDHEPRSASVEAIQDCEVVEIPRGKFDEVVNDLPKWMGSLVTTLVKRLRATGNKIRELGADNTVYKQDGDGNTVKEHAFLHHTDQFKLFGGLILAGLRHGEDIESGVKVRAGWLQIYANQVLGAPLSKVTAFTEILQDSGVIDVVKDQNKVDITIRNIDFLEEYILWLNEERLKTENKQLKLTPHALQICDAIYAYGQVLEMGEVDEVEMNMEEIYQKAQEEIGGDPFDWVFFAELTKAGLATDLSVPSAEKKMTKLNVKDFNRVYPFLNLKNRFDETNADKREVTS